MSYTFWHSGILIGESEFEPERSRPRHHAGTFHPTAYGLEIFPRLTGILTAGHALKKHLELNGLSADDMSKSEIEQFFETTPVGQKIVDIGRTLCDVEIRAPDGRRLDFTSIAFTDLSELSKLSRELALDSAETVSDLPPDAPRYVVSATLRKDRRDSLAESCRSGWLRTRHQQDDN